MDQLHEQRRCVIRTVFTFLLDASLRKSTQKLRHPVLSYSILVPAMTKRKPGRFSVTKAVKANARDRVGQPKPARVVVDTPRTGRQAKHKPKLEQVIQQEE
jgi:hypothetical protein